MSAGDALTDTATAALKAGILCRDLLSSMNPRLLAAMPEDLQMRLLSTEYQDSVDRCPPEVKAEAERRALADPWIAKARQIDKGGE